MKCGVGICGQCCVGNGIRVCLEGPVFDKNVLKNIDDFGKYKRNESGNIEYF
jgi:dihydroorotate dehydrogenase electron transfer subunit